MHRIEEWKNITHAVFSFSLFAIGSFLIIFFGMEEKRTYLSPSPNTNSGKTGEQIDK